MIDKQKFKQRFPNHLLNDKRDFELQQFSAEDMIEFAEEIALKSLVKSYKNNELHVKKFKDTDIWTLVEKSIVNENNITI